MMRINFYSFIMSDVDDPEIYMAQPICQWQDTDHGRWVMDNAKDLRYYLHADATTFGHRVTIRGILEPKQATEYFLRWPNIIF